MCLSKTRNLQCAARGEEGAFLRHSWASSLTYVRVVMELVCLFISSLVKIESGA